MGCRPSEKNCAFIMKRCKYLPKKEVEFCFECKVFPCGNLRKLDKRYRTRFKMSMIENLEFVKENGIEEFLKNQKEKYKCHECGASSASMNANAPVAWRVNVKEPLAKATDI